MPTTTSAAIRLFGKMITFYAVPGEESSVIINTRELCRQQSKFHKDDKPYGEAVYFGGTLAGLSQEYSNCTLKTSILNGLPPIIQGCSRNGLPALTKTSSMESGPISWHP